MSENFPTRPCDISHHVSLVELAECYGDHRYCLMRHHQGIQPLDTVEYRAQAVAALAYGTELSDRAGRGRWVTAVEALSAGASHEQVAAAMGVDVEQVCTGISEWAAGQLLERFITPERYADVLELIGQVPE